jgi:hypothetical protein
MGMSVSVYVEKQLPSGQWEHVPSEHGAEFFDFIPRGPVFWDILGIDCAHDGPFVDGPPKGAPADMSPFLASEIEPSCYITWHSAEVLGLFCFDEEYDTILDGIRRMQEIGVPTRAIFVFDS